MDCDTLLPLVLQAAENREHELSAPDQERLTTHLAACAECRRAVDDQRAVRSVLTARVDAEPPSDLASRVLSQVNTGASWTELFRWRTWTLRLAPVAAALVLWAVTIGGGASESSQSVGLSDITESWAFTEPEIDARPAFTLLGQDDVSGGELLDAFLSAEPDDVPIVGDSL